ncbi:hypothetical protein CXG81DRAFT_20947 [Caulochytrium protostelioides]|uniref:2,5-diamino-6-ribosylamino-4(3H)-pyrimidinone 5'-phosphate reductase n=1 Tax=Caulochytrium protostelioides TaxID=1555241 RepID=A0A4P9WZB5_9FUNG|nr:hypothetical protein CXG81DRAFT_20947 [Caulochytrium protostelioides]|eukprot:RKO98899.1 hypothetical protein CXG81DRAFT_20947 [Caulochytrium protostelioides]
MASLDTLVRASVQRACGPALAEADRATLATLLGHLDTPALQTGIADAEGARRPHVTVTWAQNVAGVVGHAPSLRPMPRARPPLRLSGDASMTMTHALRTLHSHILVGVGTVRADDPRLTARWWRGPDPTPVILDSYCTTPVAARLIQRAQHATVILAHLPFSVDDDDDVDDTHDSAGSGRAGHGAMRARAAQLQAAAPHLVLMEVPLQPDRTATRRAADAAGAGAGAGTGADRDRDRDAARAAASDDTDEEDACGVPRPRQDLAALCRQLATSHRCTSLMVEGGVGVLESFLRRGTGVVDAVVVTVAPSLQAGRRLRAVTRPFLPRDRVVLGDDFVLYGTIDASSSRSNASRDAMATGLTTS